jgi:hypothetical protein
VPAITSNATSVAVSNPVHQPSLIELVFELGLVVGAGPHLAEHADDPDQDHDVERGDQVEKCP